MQWWSHSSDESRLVADSDCSEADDEETELEDMEVEAGYERFGVAEMKEISEEDVGTEISAEDEGQSEWSIDIEECQELLGEVTTEKTRVHGSVEESGEPLEGVTQESLSKLPPDATENLSNEPIVEICTRDTASIGVPIKKNPMEDVAQESLSKPLPNEPENFANDKRARQKLKSSSESGSKQLDKFYIPEVKTCGEKKVQMNLLKKKARMELEMQNV
jgi:hypothetical protein